MIFKAKKKQKEKVFIWFTKKISLTDIQIF